VVIVRVRENQTVDLRRVHLLERSVQLLEVVLAGVGDDHLLPDPDHDSVAGPDVDEDDLRATSTVACMPGERTNGGRQRR
jgi:hypothetical protein